MWPAIADAAAAAGERVTVLPCDPAAARACLDALHETTSTTLGAIAHGCGGMLIDHGWLRILGSGHPRLTRALGAYNAELGLSVHEMLIVGDDPVGGMYVLDRGALGRRDHVFYFWPDLPQWRDLEMDLADLVLWAFAGDLAGHYERERWPGWERDLATLAGDQAWIPSDWPWTRDGRDRSKVKRRVASAAEAWREQRDALSTYERP